MVRGQVIWELWLYPGGEERVDHRRDLYFRQPSGFWVANRCWGTSVEVRTRLEDYWQSSTLEMAAYEPQQEWQRWDMVNFFLGGRGYFIIYLLADLFLLGYSCFTMLLASALQQYMVNFWLWFEGTFGLFNRGKPAWRWTCMVASTDDFLSRS